jgi:hypothetical protein
MFKWGLIKTRCDCRFTHKFYAQKCDFKLENSLFLVFTLGFQIWKLFFLYWYISNTWITIFTIELDTVYQTMLHCLYYSVRFFLYFTWWLVLKNSLFYKNILDYYWVLLGVGFEPLVWKVLVEEFLFETSWLYSLELVSICVCFMSFRTCYEKKLISLLQVPITFHEFKKFYKLIQELQLMFLFS